MLLNKFNATTDFKQLSAVVNREDLQRWHVTNPIPAYKLDGKKTTHLTVLVQYIPLAMYDKLCVQPSDGHFTSDSLPQTLLHLHLCQLFTRGWI